MVRDELLDGTDPDRPPNDALFEALSDEYRRYFLYLLMENDAVSRDELREAMGDWVASPEAETTADRLAVRFYHVDIPVMLQAKLVQYDPGADSFALNAVSADVRAILRRARERETSGIDFDRDSDSDADASSNGDPG